MIIWLKYNCLKKDVKRSFYSMEITKDTIIGDVLDAYPDTAPLF